MSKIHKIDLTDFDDKLSFHNATSYDDFTTFRIQSENARFYELLFTTDSLLYFINCLSSVQSALCENNENPDKS